MKNLEVLTRDEVSPQTQEVYNKLSKALGMVPNSNATAAHSHQGLTALLGLDEVLKKGNFSGKEVEAVALAVGQTNDCNYCLAAHTTVGKLKGFTVEETLDIRSGEIEDIKLKALTNLAKEVTATRGLPARSTIESFHNAGYSKGALVDLIGLVALNTFTNYLNHIADTEIDFPLAPQVKTGQAA